MNIKNKIYECFVIGEDHFTLACVAVLKKYGFVIRLICTNNSQLIYWAGEHDIAVCSSYSVFEKRLLNTQYHFLFSILNGKILPEKIINRAKILSINFHNSYLPKYAGSHTTSWSILNGESQHGVTWHKMSEKIDQGHIIKQAVFPIENHDTAMSLNVKCMEWGLKTFEEMLVEINEGTYLLKEQDPALRLYFPKLRKPKGNALINWFDTAENLSSLFRACNYGSYNNEFALPKIGLNERMDFILVKQLTITSDWSSFLPGTVVNMANNMMVVATETYDVCLSDFLSFTGNSLSILAIESIYGVTVKTLLPHYSVDRMHALQVTSEAYFHHEKIWAKKLATAKVPTVPLMPQLASINYSKYTEISSFNLDCMIVRKIRESSKNSMSEISFTILLIYLQRINNYEICDIGFSKNNAPLEENIENLFFNFSWLTCHISPEKNFYDYLAEVSLEINDKKHQTNCLKDILSRYVNLNRKYILPNIVMMLDDQNIDKIKTGLLIKINGCQVSLYLSEFESKLEEEQLYLINSMEYKIKKMLQGLEGNIKLPVYKLPLLNKNNMSLYVDSWSHTEERMLPHEEMIKIFEKQAAKNPTKTAIIHNDKSITYQVLNQQANHLAKSLLDMNNTPGGHIGVISLSCIETIVALLAILKIRGIYVPIDPDYPASYLSYILDDTKPKIILSGSFPSSHFKAFLKDNYSETVFFPFTFFNLVDASSHNLEISGNENPLAYIMYTSGSTGQPKGVPIYQDAILRLVIDNNFLEIKSEHTVAQASNLSFDASTFEIWGALLNGATLVCIEKEIVLDPLKFKKILVNHSVDVLWVTSSLLDRLVQNDAAIFNNVQYLLSGGDIVNAHTVKKIFKSCSANKGRIQLFLNGYGPTENTTFTTVYAIKPTDKISENIPIGKPIAHDFVYVLDKYLQPVCVGTPGELFISSIGLTPGYIDYPERNQSHFIETALITGKIQRYFKTGDYVKWLSDGNLAYIGRKDSQVKLRGFRVDINAIKTILLKHNEISQCHVMLDSGKLYVYIIPEEPASIQKEQVSSYLKARLPHYMMPSEIFFLEQFPLTPNGKIDSSFIKELIITTKKRILKKPTNDIEKFLLKVWKNILNVDEISIEDNFFDIGGNSLMIATLIYKIYNKFNHRLMISAFLMEPTISSLGSLIAGNLPKAQKNNSLLNDLAINPISNISPMVQKVKREKLGRNILVTGATGFLGSFLVNELAKDGNNNIYCIIRSNTYSQAKEKLRKNFEKWGLKSDVVKNIYILTGNLSEKNLGLSLKNYRMLLEELDEIFHAAAQVNHIYSYTQLREDNVISTFNLSQMLNSNKDIQLNFISTMSACYDHLDDSHHIKESFVTETQLSQKIVDGYSLTKWVSEIMLYKMHSSGFKIKIFRPAWISGHSDTGLMPMLNNHLYLLLKGCIQLGYAPKWNTRINMTPVDKLAEIIVVASRTMEMDRNVFNLINNEAVHWIDYINTAKDFGYDIQLIDSQKWYKLIAAIDENNALFPLASIYADPKNQDWVLKQDSISDACNKNYLAVKEQIVYNTVIDKMLLKKYLEYVSESDEDIKNDCFCL